MSDERWDVPDERLARIASRAEHPPFRLCGHCDHRHPRGEECGYQHDPRYSGNPTCKCRS